VFWEKRPQTIENQGRECRKERKEREKRRQIPENNGFATEARVGREIGGLYPHTPGGFGWM
jgi:hypothetical protein